MPRRLVPLQAGECYHLYNRGHNRCNIFLEPANYQFFLRRFQEYVVSEHCQVMAYVLMPNHYQFLISTRDQELSTAMQRFSISYTKAINERFGRVGSLFQGAFRAKHVEDENYVRHLSRYIHLNPVRAGLCGRPRDWAYSSYREYVDRVNICQTSEVSEDLGSLRR